MPKLLRRACIDLCIWCKKNNKLPNIGSQDNLRVCVTFMRCNLPIFPHSRPVSFCWIFYVQIDIYINWFIYISLRIFMIYVLKKMVNRLAWITLMLRPVSWASCSRMCLVGFGVAAKAALRSSSCLALMVVRGPRRFPPRFCSSFSLLPASLSDKLAISESLPSSCGSWESGDKLGSLQVVTVT